MSVQTIFRDIEFAADKPLRKRRFPLENFFPRRTPEKFIRFAPPEFVRLLDRFPIHPLILTEAFNTSLLCEIFGRFENALLDEMRFDIVLHEQSLICRRNFSGQAFRLGGVEAVATATARAFCNLRVSSLRQAAAGQGRRATTAHSLR